MKCEFSNNITLIFLHIISLFATFILSDQINKYMNNKFHSNDWHLKSPLDLFNIDYFL